MPLDAPFLGAIHAADRMPPLVVARLLLHWTASAGGSLGRVRRAFDARLACNRQLKEIMNVPGLTA